MLIVLEKINISRVPDVYVLPGMLIEILIINWYIKNIIKNGAPFRFLKGKGFNYTKAGNNLSNMGQIISLGGNCGQLRGCILLVRKKYWKVLTKVNVY